MANSVEVKVPDIGDFKGIPVIEVLVKVGDTIKVDDSVVTLESDKATMDVPSSVAGVVTEVRLKVGDSVSEGTVVALVDVAASAAVVTSSPVGAGDTPSKTSDALAAAPVAAPVEVPVTPAHTRATSRRNPKPEYPSIARRRGWEGKVLLRINVRADGLPGKIEVAESSGREVLDESALRAVKRWTFTPAMRGAEAVDSTLTLSIVFKLKN